MSLGPTREFKWKDLFGAFLGLLFLLMLGLVIDAAYQFFKHGT